MVNRVLLSIPDAKPIQKILTVGKTYHVFGALGNGLVILCDDMKTRAVVLESRFGKGASCTG